MPLASVNSLREVRERLVGYRFETVVRLTGIDPARLRAVEEGASPTVFEAEALARVYGVEADLLVETPIRLRPGDAVAALADLEEFREIDDITRAHIIGAANAARDLVTLRRLAGEPDPRTLFFRQAPRLPRPRRSDAPYRQGARIAAALRRSWSLGAKPIASLRDLAGQRLPSVAVLHADLGAYGPAGLTFADPLRGPTIVLNLAGKNRNPAVRRFSLAHELGHLLMDWNRQESLAVISGYLTESGLERERRANAFAVRLVCPEAVLDRLDLGRVPEAAAVLLQRYGLHYAAARLCLRMERGAKLPPEPPPEVLAVGTEGSWAAAEEPTGVAAFPLSAVPVERRTLVAALAARRYSQGHLSRSRFAEYLGTTPVQPVEAVLDFFGLDPPADTASA